MRFVFLICGILLPAFTLGFELLTTGCADLFFDPIPSLGHVLLVGLVPLANLLVLLRVTGCIKGSFSWFALISGAAVSIASVYALVFLPLVPVAVLGIIFFGLGLLPLAPLLALIASVYGSSWLRRTATAQGSARLLRVWPGMVVGLVLLLAAELPGLLTRAGVAMATSSSPSERARGLSWLRRVGSREQLLWLCYGRQRALSLSGALGDRLAPVSPHQAQAVFFQVTGRPFNDFPPPRRHRAWALDLDFDPDRGGTAVAGRVEGLALASSRLDGTVETGAALAYLEWTLVFRNDSAMQQEARAQIALPPDGVVSRLTLWVNDEPREAAFSGTSQVRQAYEAVVQQRRDPVLVTACGPDRVLMQCFPVPPRGGTMKVRLGMTVPLLLRRDGQAFLKLPCFAEHNFVVPTGPCHDVWVEAEQPLESAGLRAEQPKGQRHCLRGSLTEEGLKTSRSALRVGGPGPAPRAWTLDPRSTAHIITQEVRTTRMAAVERLVVVIDSSAGMASHVDELATVIAQLPHEVDLRVLVAGDTVTDLSEAARGETKRPFRDQLRDLCGSGGCDNVPALVQGWELANGSTSALVWVHAAQPVLLDPVEPLLQRFERRSGAVPFHDVQVSPGPDRVLEKLTEAAGVQVLAHTGPLADDLDHLFAVLIGKADSWRITRRREDAGASGEQGLRASDHVARLWAREQVLAGLHTGTPAREEAARLAASYQLVTPVSGAVVLETKEQFERAGLQPVSAEEAPQLSPAKGPFAHAGPEPAFWLVLLIVAAVLLGEAWSRWKRCPST